MTRRGKGSAGAAAAPRQAAALVQQALAFHQRGAFAEAEKGYRAALQLNRAHSDAHHLLGLLLMEREAYDEAAQHVRQALAGQPGHPTLLNSLGEILRRRGDLPTAGSLFRSALQANPRYGEAWHNLGKVFAAQGALAEGEEALRRAVQLAPGNPRAHFDLGELLRRLHRLPEAVECFGHASALQPGWEVAWNSLGLALKNCGRLREAIAVFARHVDQATDPQSISNHLLTLSYDEELAPGDLLAEHRRLSSRLAPPGVVARPPVPRAHGPRRIGFVSADLRNHAMRFFIEPLLQGLGELSVELYAYYSYPQEDAVTALLKPRFAVFRDVCGMDDDALAACIVQDEIDVLVDLSGHTAYHRLGIFARRPAPLQVSWIGYLPSSGLSCFDARITDALALPPAMQVAYSEPLAYLNCCQWCYAPPAEAPLPQRAPALPARFRFGGLHTPAKLNPRVLNLWARILTAVPGSELLLMADGADTVAAALRQRIPDGAARVITRPSGPLQDFLAAHNEVDLALDAFPYSGGTTTLHALWMGVPVLTLRADHAAGRGGASILGHLGLDDYVCDDADRYAERAIALAARGPRGDQERLALREAVRRSPLTDGRGFAAEFLRLLRALPQQGTQQKGAADA